MVHDEYGLLSFVDAQPAEQLGTHSDEVACVVAVISDDEGGLGGLKQYKTYPSLDRVAEARRLASAIDQGSLRLHANACFAHFGEIERYGEEVLTTIPKHVISRSGGGYKVAGQRLGRDQAVVAAWYAAALVFFGLFTARWAEKIGVGRISFLCDLLPSVPEVSMKAVLAASLLCPDLKTCWDETRRQYGVEITVANIHSFRSPNGPSIPGKDHPEMILADWLAHSFHAAENPTKRVDGGAGRTEKYREAIAAPWLALQKKDRRTFGIELVHLSPNPGSSIDPNRTSVRYGNH